ncbi:uncharacterized protein [Leuresthes tenuis]|uniref:uncharacterized protein n=1 Tax=Leuresthes tenuis TaxID=355514 RepID=UPI003B50F38E
MLTLFCIALVITSGRCMDDETFATKTVHVGEDVTLTCSRRSETSAFLFWTKLIAGKLPQILGATYTFDGGIVNNTPGFSAGKKPGTFVLHITQTKLSDTAFYYCEEIDELQKRYLNVTFLRVKGQKPDIPAIIQEFPFVPVHAGDSVTLQCSILSESESHMCPGFHKVFLFQVSSTEPQPRVIYAHGNNRDKCSGSAEANSSHKCDYNFSISNISPFDMGTYYCAVVTCGQILFGNGTKLGIEAPQSSESYRTNVVLFSLCGALAISLIVIVLLINTIKKKNKCESCKAAADATITTDQLNQPTNEDTLVYSVASFTRRKANQRGRRDVKVVEQETIYSDVRALGYE